MVILFRKPKSGPLAIPIVGSLARGAYRKLILLPGHNEVKKETWLKVMDLVQVKKYRERGWLTEKGDFKVEIKTTPSGKEGELSKREKVATVKEFKTFPSNEAEAMVKETYDLKTLDKWNKKEERDSVRIAIKEQISVVENYDAKKQKEKDDDLRGRGSNLED